MPSSIPPPPPQPSLAETRLAVRRLALLCAAGLAFFLLYSTTYHPDGWMVRYGRNDSTTWMLWRLQQLDEAKLRAHPGGRIAWLVGPSILREAFDERETNRLLAIQQSPWRVVQLGFTRGAAGLSSGLVDRLPIRAGDRVVHSVTLENFHTRWLKFTGMKGHQVAALLPVSAWWSLPEWSLQDKLELAVALPRNFWSFQDDAMEGWVQWLNAPWFGLPKVRTRNFALSGRDWEGQRPDHEARTERELKTYSLNAGNLDLSPSQFNQMGLARLRARCAAVGAELRLIDIPPRQEYQRRFLDAEAQEIWDRWREAQPEMSYFPQLPEEGYFDQRHPNLEGQRILSPYLAAWLDRPVVGSAQAPRWPMGP